MALPQSKKDKYLPLLLIRDGNNCLYCQEPLSLDDFNYEHLDNDENNNDFANLCIAHHKCNCLKRTFAEYQIIAKEKLEENKKTKTLFLGGRNNALEDPEGRQEQSLEMKVRTDTYQITKQYLEEHIQADVELELKDTVDCLTFYCMENTGHGSQKVITSHINALCSSMGKFVVLKDSKTKKKIIMKRSEN